MTILLTLRVKGPEFTDFVDIIALGNEIITGLFFFYQVIFHSFFFQKIGIY